MDPSVLSFVIAVVTMYSPSGSCPWCERHLATTSNDTESLCAFIAESRTLIKVVASIFLQEIGARKAGFARDIAEDRQYA